MDRRGVEYLGVAGEADPPAAHSSNVVTLARIDRKAYLPTTRVRHQNGAGGHRSLGGPALNGALGCQTLRDRRRCRGRSIPGGLQLPTCRKRSASDRRENPRRLLLRESVRRNVGLGSQLFVIVGFVVLAGCHASMKLSAKQIDDLHRNCQEKIDKGSFSTRGSKNVGFLENRPAGTPVIIYGASWCKACDAAASYLTRRGIPFVEKDIEENAVARAGLDTALAGAGLGGTKSLPVIDIRGTVTVGFLPCVVDSAWSAPQRLRVSDQP